MKQIFINVPVKDVNLSMDFYSELGFTANPLFTFDNQKCLTWGDQIYLMLQTHSMFKSGNNKSISDAKTNTTVSFTLPVESFDKVNEIVEKGLKAGGMESTPMIDEGFMQVRNIEDLDGHSWSLMYLDVYKFKLLTGKHK